MARLIRVSKLQAQMLSRAGVATIYVTRKQPKAEDVMSEDSQSMKPCAERRKSASLNRLEQAEYFKLYKWIEAAWPEISKEPGILRGTVAQRATAALGFLVTEHHIFGALKSMGLGLPGVKRVVKTGEAVRILAEVVTMLVNEIPLLGAKVSEKQLQALKELL